MSSQKSILLQMGFGRLSYSTYRKVIAGSSSPKNLPTCLYSTLPVQRYTNRKPWKPPLIELSNRIRHITDHSVSIIPILDQWIQEVEYIHEDQLLLLIRNLRFRKRYVHALEVSTWMTSKRHFVPTSPDVAIRLALISKVHGIQEAENYSNSIPHPLRSHYVYGTLLNCYASVKSVDKAESVMQRMKDLGYAQTSLPYNIMLNLYYQIGNAGKLDNLMQDMEQNCVEYSKHTYKILAGVHAAASDVEGMWKTLKRMESDYSVLLDWATYTAVAEGCINLGLLEKALEMLKITEGLITVQRRGAAYDSLIKLYAAVGEKDEVLRVWELYKKRVYNRRHVGVIAALLKLDDLESVEKIFVDWESCNLWYDMIVPNFLIRGYSRKGLVEKAETLVHQAISKGGKPNTHTWCHLAVGYLQNYQTSKAVEAIKKAILVCDPHWKSSNESLATWFDNFKGEGDIEKLEDLIKSLCNINVTSSQTESIYI